MIDHYFDHLEETLLENELKDCPCQILTWDAIEFNPYGTHRVFSQLLNSAWHDSMTSKKNIIAGFHTTGVYPTDRYAIILPGETKIGKCLHAKLGCHSFLSTLLGNRPLHPA